MQIKVKRFQIDRSKQYFPLSLVHILILNLNPESLYKSLDKSGFETIFKTHYTALCHFAYRYVNDKDTSQDIVQEVFIAMWQKKETITSEKPVKSYLFTAVKNRCLNYIRDHKKFRSYQLDVEIELEIPVEEMDVFSGPETQTQINQALDKLPPKCRQVFELSRYKEMKYKEIAAKLGISVKTVEVQMSKALKILREELADLIVQGPPANPIL